jgi:hypothetical protein
LGAIFCISRVISFWGKSVSRIRNTVIDLNSTADFNEFCRSAELFGLQPLCTGSDTQWITVDTVDFCIQSRNIRDLFERFYTPNNLYLSRELNQVFLIDSLNLPHCTTSAQMIVRKKSYSSLKVGLNVGATIVPPCTCSAMR